MHPSLSRAAKEALRSALLELDPLTSETTIRELLACGIVEPGPPQPDRVRRYVFTTLGARWKLNVHLEDDDARPCRCGLTWSEHDPRSPHAALTGLCRSFTSARPELHSTAPRARSEAPIHEVPRRCANSPGHG